MCGYPYHDLRPPERTPEETDRLVACIFSKRGREEAERTWALDEAMLREIAARPEVEEMY
ncbi:MAG: hypothetical protein KOO60_10815 [Gemmatimonadales bacterium]|nr:hypothetical protein [Gemmatimonadales bacterium]